MGDQGGVEGGGRSRQAELELGGDLFTGEAGEVWVLSEGSWRGQGNDRTASGEGSADATSSVAEENV